MGELPQANANTTIQAAPPYVLGIKPEIRDALPAYHYMCSMKRGLDAQLKDNPTEQPHMASVQVPGPNSSKTRTPLDGKVWHIHTTHGFAFSPQAVARSACWHQHECKPATL